MKPRLISGDTPTGRLHLGHYVGSLEQRLALQATHECFFFVANIHAFTTRAERVSEIREHTLDIILDYLAVGIDPKICTLFIQSEIPAIAELTILLSMLLPYQRLMRNPTVKDEIVTKQLGDNYPFGFLLYPVGQMADILSFKAQVVPVGEDQFPLVEMTREIARRFNQVYCGVSPHLKDIDYPGAGGIFPIPDGLGGRIKRLVGTTGPNSTGQLPKMSKSLNNAIFLSDTPDVITQKVMGMYTDPNRLRATDKGTVENNPLWIFHDAFNSDVEWVNQTKELYREGRIGDVACKKKLIEVLVDLIEPIRLKRLQYEQDIGQVMKILSEGCEKANQISQETLKQVKQAMQQDYFA